MELLWARNSIRCQDTPLKDNTKAQFLGLPAGGRKIDASILVFGCKDRFTGLDEGQHFLTPPLGKAIFRDGKVKIGKKVFHLVGSILHSDGQPTLMRLHLRAILHNSIGLRK